MTDQIIMFISQLFNGLKIGSVYALVALGYTMVYGIIRLINFAHGDFIMVGAYVLMLTIPAIVAMGLPAWVAVLLENGSQAIFGADFQTVPTIFHLPSIAFGKLKLPGDTLLTIVIGLVIMVGLQLFVKFTRQGKAMRAVSEDKEAAVLMGINVNSTIALTFAIGSGLAAVASLMYCAAYPQVSPMMGAMLGLKAFVAAVLGGIGSIPGAMIGGLAIGLIESLTKAYIGTITAGIITSAFSDAIVFAILIIVLLVKPSGIMGKNEGEKV